MIIVWAQADAAENRI